MWLNDLFWGKRNTFVGKLSVLGDEWSPLRALSACGQILHKNPVKGQTPPPVPAMPGFLEFLFRHPIPNQNLLTNICEPRFVNQDSWTKIREPRFVNQDLWTKICEPRFLNQDLWTKICEPIFGNQNSWTKICGLELVVVNSLSWTRQHELVVWTRRHEIVDVWS